MEAKRGHYKKKIFGDFEIWIWRQMMKVPWTEHKTNEEILKMVETERKIMDTIRSQQKRWLGHILRHDSLLRLTLEGLIQGKKTYGRPRNNASGLATEDRGRQYQLRRTKDVCPGQI